MRANTFKAVDIGREVTVHDFGHHLGTIVEKNPTITIQDRTFTADGWLKVRLADGREWNGDAKLVAIGNNADCSGGDR